LRESERKGVPISTKMERSEAAKSEEKFLLRKMSLRSSEFELTFFSSEMAADDDEFLRFQAELAAVEAEATAVADDDGDKTAAAAPGDASGKEEHGVKEKEEAAATTAAAAASEKLPPPPPPPTTTTTTKLPPPPPPPPSSTKQASIPLSFVPAAVSRPKAPAPPLVRRSTVVIAAPAVAGPQAPPPPPPPQPPQQFYPAPPPPFTHQQQQQQFYPQPVPPQYGGYAPPPPCYQQQQQQVPYPQQQAFAAGAAATAAAAGGNGAAGGASASASTPAENPTKKRALPRMMGGEAWYDPKLAEWPENDFRIFVGDVGADVDDAQLAAAFARFPSFAMARVVRDRRTGKNRGYGFVSFADPVHGATALREMDGKHVGQRPVRLRKSSWEERSGEGATAAAGSSRLPSRERFKKHCIVPRADSLRKGKGF